MKSYLMLLAAMLCPTGAGALTRYEITATIASRIVRDAYLNGGVGKTQIASGFLETGQQISIRYSLIPANNPPFYGDPGVFRIVSPHFNWIGYAGGGSSLNGYTTNDGSEWQVAGGFDAPWVVLKTAFPVVTEPNYLTDSSKKLAISDFEQPYLSISYATNYYGIGQPSLSFKAVGYDTDGGVELFFSDVVSRPIAGIPEPEMWLTLVLGFSFVGVMARKDRAALQS